MTTLLTTAALVVGGLIALALLLLGLPALALWIRTRRHRKRGLTPVHTASMLDHDTDELPIPSEQEGHTE